MSSRFFSRLARMPGSSAPLNRNSDSERDSIIAANLTKTWSNSDEYKWNRLSEGMSQFHEIFKHQFDTVYKLADGSFNQRGLTLPKYLKIATDLINHLNMHHSVEEQHVFPKLAEHMPAFAMQTQEGHIKSHEAIHHGLDELSALVSKWTAEPSTYSSEEMRACLDGFREVLLRHLDDEVQDLNGENLKKYWTLDEIERIKM